MHAGARPDAKRAVALRNRWRRLQVDAELRPEITPKNILIIGPTGVGKTEIARRLHAAMERLHDGVSFGAAAGSASRVRVDSADVEQTLGQLARDQDLRRCVL